MERAGFSFGKPAAARLASTRLSMNAKSNCGDSITPVNDVLMQIVKTVDGNYQSLDYFSLP